MIRKEGSQWALYTKDGSRLLGKHKTREGAVSQEQAIEASKERGWETDRRKRKAALK